jgi:hypothetical protein
MIDCGGIKPYMKQGPGSYGWPFKAAMESSFCASRGTAANHDLLNLDQNVVDTSYRVY